MRLMRYICRTCGTEVADTRTGTLLSCPQHPSAVMDAVIVHDQQGPEIREDEEETRMRAIEYVQIAFYVVLKPRHDILAISGNLSRLDFQRGTSV